MRRSPAGPGVTRCVRDAARRCGERPAADRRPAWTYARGGYLPGPFRGRVGAPYGPVAAPDAAGAGAAGAGPPNSGLAKFSSATSEIFRYPAVRRSFIAAIRSP